MGVILSKDELVRASQDWQANNLTVVVTNGCFDLLHVGHLRTFYEAKKFGDILVVGINSDRSVKALKGETRPIISETDRSQLIAALEPVDAVTVFDELSATALLETVKPSVYVKGGDYSLDNLPEKDVVLKYGITVKFIPLVQGISTTELVRRIRTANFN